MEVLNLKLVSAIFIKFLFCIKWKPFKNYKKCFLLHLESSFPPRDIQIFVFSSSPLFFPVSHSFRGGSKKNIKFYDIIDCLNMNLITNFVWYLEKEIRCDMETLSTDRELNKENFYRKIMQHQKQAPDPFLILLNNWKQSSHARNSFKNKTF